MNSTRKILTVTLMSLSLAGVASSALAETKWEKNHPRRDQVNDRLAKQNARIKTEVKEGELTKGQAANLHTQDRQIRTEEKLMASQNGGHITKLEQKTLNQQENAVSKEIGK